VYRPYARALCCPELWAVSPVVPHPHSRSPLTPLSHPRCHALRPPYPLQLEWLVAAKGFQPAGGQAASLHAAS